MPLQAGILSAAHLHVWGYAHGFKAHPDVELVGIWDDDVTRGQEFAKSVDVPWIPDLDELLSKVQVVGITSENKKHAELVEKAAIRGCHILCEKPLVTNEEEAARLLSAVADAGVKLMTAFPCRFSPAFVKLKERIRAGELGTIKAICATNRGRCPFGWFVETEQSGGGAMIDHVVHVADLLQDLLGATPVRVQAQIGNNIHGKDWDDTAMLTLEYPGGVFATLDSSWSRPTTYRTWGDVTMNVVGEKGVIELNMFGQELQAYGHDKVTHRSAGYGSDLDAQLVSEFIAAVQEDRQPLAGVKDGLAAARVAMAGYRSVKEGQPVVV